MSDFEIRANNIEVAISAAYERVKEFGYLVVTEKVPFYVSRSPQRVKSKSFKKFSKIESCG